MKIDFQRYWLIKLQSSRTRGTRRSKTIWKDKFRRRNRPEGLIVGEEKEGYGFIAGQTESISTIYC
jgi:hypothetical protein